MIHHLSLYARLMRLDKPIGILLLLWPTLWGLVWAAGGVPPTKETLVFVAGTILMRSAGCVVNDYADRNFDGHVARTAQRPLATGAVGAREALLLAAVLAVFAAGLLVFLNPLTQILAVPAAVLAGSYPFFKRFFAIPQAYLGIAFGFGMVMAFAAVRNALPPEAWVLLLANVFWTVAYDTEYAMVDKADDLKIGIKTSAITFGRWDVAAVMACYAGFLGLMAVLGADAGWHGGYFVGLSIAAGLAVYHYHLIRHREPSACFAAFLHNHWVGLVVFLAVCWGTMV